MKGRINLLKAIACRLELVRPGSSFRSHHVSLAANMRKPLLKGRVQTVSGVQGVFLCRGSWECVVCVALIP